MSDDDHDATKKSFHRQPEFSRLTDTHDLPQFIYPDTQPTLKITQPELSEWTCYMFGGAQSDGVAWRPFKGQEPNWFHRWMQKWCFRCTWIKDE
ncbi:MAG: hypothetical protein GY903_00940 [Fuerstiella sp.]|nr:hypothetical protein [Fuerstiella sp.]